MSSASLGKWNSTWDGLPGEIRLLILKALVRDGCTLSHLATVSREWQAELERHNFARIKLTPSRLVDFGAMTRRNRTLVHYIWFCFELYHYDCTKCGLSPGIHSDGVVEEAYAVTDTGSCPITTAFEDLFSVLSTWVPSGDLMLDISIYSPSDSKHWFKYLTFMPDAPSEMIVGDGAEQGTSNNVYDDHAHGWVAGFRHTAPPTTAVRQIFYPVMAERPFDSEQLERQWWDQLPPVPAVTSLLLRLQNHRRWKPGSLAHMFGRFPNLKEVHYEPWREWDFMQRYTDKAYKHLFRSIPSTNSNLKRLVVFENFNQQYPASMSRYLLGVDMNECDTTRIASSAVSRAVALASLKLEHLAASFIVDASHFFEIEPSWEWPNLTSLVLTSKLLTPDGDPSDIGALLQAAAAAATKMPRLETMEIWNGRRGLAALFKYQTLCDRGQAIITWRGTWGLIMEPSIIQAWQAVVHHYDGWGLKLVQERLDETVIKSHADAIHHLRLSSQVIRAISLQQIRQEQKALEGVTTS